MGRGKTRAAAACVIAVTALAATAMTGCGSESHPNDPRPAQPTQVTATIGANAITISPRIVGFRGEPTPTLAQNEGVSEPSSRSTGPLTVIFKISNTIPRPTRLLITGITKHRSDEIVASGTDDFSVDLQAGIYLVRAEGLPTVTASRFVVGADRPTSDNQLLIP